jgi:hypothetical protein
MLLSGDREWARGINRPVRRVIRRVLTALRIQPVQQALFREDGRVVRECNGGRARFPSDDSAVDQKEAVEQVRPSVHIAEKRLRRLA